MVTSFDYNLLVSGEIARRQGEGGIVQGSSVCCSCFRQLLRLSVHSTDVAPWNTGGFGGCYSFLSQKEKRKNSKSPLPACFLQQHLTPLYSRLPVTFTESHFFPLSTQSSHRFHVSSLDPLFLLTLFYTEATVLSLGRKPAPSVVYLSCQYWDWDISNSTLGSFYPRDRCYLCKSPM